MMNKKIKFAAALWCLGLLCIALFTACDAKNGPRLIQIQSDLGIVVPWTYELIDFKEEWTDTSFSQLSIFEFDEGDTQFLMEQITASPFYNLFPIELLPQLSIGDQEKFHTQLEEKRKIGYWLPKEKGYYFFCPAFNPSITEAPPRRLLNYTDKGVHFVVLAHFDIDKRRLRYNYQSFTTPQKEWQKWNEQVDELKKKASEVAKILD